MLTAAKCPADTTTRWQQRANKTTTRGAREEELGSPTATGADEPAEPRLSHLPGL